MKTREVNYNISHLDLFDIDGDVELLKIQTEFNNEAITILIDDIPVISTGLRLINKNTGEIWLVKSKYLAKYKIYVIKRLMELITFYSEKYKLKRMQTLINTQNEKWIKCLGFEKETELKNFSDETTFIYRRLFKWE